MNSVAIPEEEIITTRLGRAALWAPLPFLQFQLVRQE
jgi:hypothetical protein